MKRARRSDIIRQTRLYLADLIDAMDANGDGYYGICGEDGTDEEHALVADTARRVAESIRRRTK